MMLATTAGSDLHEVPGSLFVFGLKDHEPKGLVERFGCAPRENHLTRVSRLRQAREVLSDHAILGIRPGSCVMHTRGQVQDVDVLLTLTLWLSVGRRARGHKHSGARRMEAPFGALDQVVPFVSRTQM